MKTSYQIRIHGGNRASVKNPSWCTTIGTVEIVEGQLCPNLEMSKGFSVRWLAFNKSYGDDADIEHNRQKGYLELESDEYIFFFEFSDSGTYSRRDFTPSYGKSNAYFHRVVPMNTEKEVED